MQRQKPPSPRGLLPAVPVTRSPVPRRPLDYTACLDELMRHVVPACPALAHINTDNLLSGLSQSRAGGEHGVFATIQGLRFEGGADTVTRGSRCYRWPRLVFEDREILYVILFMMPRFADLPFRKKLTTVFHELYHVSPTCDGDLRRFPGRNFAHGQSRESYNARLQPWIDSYLSCSGSEDATKFLTLNFRELQEQYSGVVGRRVAPMKPVAARPAHDGPTVADAGG